jgi:hypothetical protein
VNEDALNVAQQDYQGIDFRHFPQVQRGKGTEIRADPQIANRRHDVGVAYSGYDSYRAHGCAGRIEYQIRADGARKDVPLLLPYPELVNLD